MIRFIQIEIMTSPILKDARFQRGKNDRWTRLNCSLSPFLWATIYENIIHKNMDMTFWPTYLLKLCPNFCSVKNMVWANPTYLWFGICPNFRSFFFLDLLPYPDFTSISDHVFLCITLYIRTLLNGKYKSYISSSMWQLLMGDWPHAHG